MAEPTLRPAHELLDLDAVARRYDRLIAAYQQAEPRDVYAAWALEAAVTRRSLLPRVGRLLDCLPPLTMQVLHGDLAAVNVLLRGDDVAAIIDFEPPRVRYLSWEIARVACDPARIVAHGSSWSSALDGFVDAYRSSHPSTREADLTSVAAVGCAYTLASTYPLAEPLTIGQRGDDMAESLQRYGRDRHHAALVMLEHLDA